MFRVAVTADYKALCSAGRIDVVIDATGNPNVGTLVALEAMASGCLSDPAEVCDTFLQGVDGILEHCAGSASK